jgi:hypothetical protein
MNTNPLERIAMRPNVAAAFPRPVKRADEVFQHILSEYNFAKTQIKPDQTINLICIVGGIYLEVGQVSSRDYYLEMRGHDENDDFHIMSATIDQIVFDIKITKKINDEPPRVIGFKVETGDVQPTEKRG